MATITVPGMFLTGNHAALPAASAVGKGTLYSCTTHSLIYQTTDGATWGTWLTAGSTVSAGSNSTRVRELSTAGASSTLWSPFDHAHDGIGTITASSSNTLQRGTVNLRSGNNISFGLTDSDGDGEFDTLTVHGAAAGGGASGVTVQDEGTPLATTGTTLNFVGAGVAATGTGATKTITIAGGGDDPISNQFGTPDTAYEFSTNSFTGLTAMGTLDTESMATTVPGHYFVSDNDAAQAGRYAAVSAPFTAIVKVSDSSLRIANYQYVGMFCGEATPGKMVWVGSRYSDGAGVVTLTLTGPTDGSPGTPAVVQAPPTDAVFSGFYVAIVATSTTSISYYWSKNGVVWFTILSAHDNSMTVGAVGMSIAQYANTNAVTAAYDFMRIWNSAKTIPV